MSTCSHCHTSMIPEYSSSWGERNWLWKCLGCGREQYQDAQCQVDEERDQTGAAAGQERQDRSAGARRSTIERHGQRNTTIPRAAL